MRGREREGGREGGERERKRERGREREREGEGAFSLAKCPTLNIAIITQSK